MIRGSGTTLVEREADFEDISLQRGKARVLTRTNLPGANQMTPHLVTPMVANGTSMEEALTRILDSMGEQNE